MISKCFSSFLTFNPQCIDISRALEASARNDSIFGDSFLDFQTPYATSSVSRFPWTLAGRFALVVSFILIRTEILICYVLIFAGFYVVFLNFL